MIYKFRAWDIENKHMLSWEEIQEQWETEGYSNSIFDNDHYICMQYVGLKDENKTEIYEGDVLSIKELDKDWNVTEHITDVSYEESAFVCKSKTNYDYYDCFLSEYHGDPFKCSKPFKIKVVGNVYQEKYRYSRGE